MQYTAKFMKAILLVKQCYTHTYIYKADIVDNKKTQSICVLINKNKLWSKNYSISL